VLGFAAGPRAGARRRLGARIGKARVGEIRVMGYFYGIDPVKHPVTSETFDDDESERHAMKEMS
jgi:hypothetical protein